MRHSMQRIRAVCVITASSVACVLPLVAADPLDRANELFGGRVRQHWQRSTDGGQTWSTVFDGTYVRRP